MKISKVITFNKYCEQLLKYYFIQYIIHLISISTQRSDEESIFKISKFKLCKIEYTSVFYIHKLVIPALKYILPAKKKCWSPYCVLDGITFSKILDILLLKWKSEFGTKIFATCCTNVLNLEYMQLRIYQFWKKKIFHPESVIEII